MSTETLEKIQKLETIGEDVPVAYYELVDQRPSGFIQEGTERLAQPNEKTAPTMTKLRSRSYYFKKDSKGVLRRVDIRYIYGVEEIDVIKQDERKFQPNPVTDNIFLKDGKFAVAREGSTIGLYDYLKKASFNETNPERDPAAEIRIREVVPEKAKAESNDLEFDIAEAMLLVKDLILSRAGDKIRYDEVKLNAYCSVFSVSAEHNSGKLNTLIGLAKSMPTLFKEKIKAFENRFATEIVHAEELGLIKYNGNTVEYVAKPEIIFSMPGAFVKKDLVREKLAAFFQSEEGAQAYAKFLIELEGIKASKANS